MSPSSQSSANSRSGFTLLEVLLAVAVLGMLVMCVYGTWNAALTSWRRGSQVTEDFQRERIVMDALTELTKSAIFFASSPSLYTFVATKNPGIGDSISFVTASDAYLPPSEAIAAGMRRVVISLEQDEYRRTYLAIVNEPALRPNDDSSLPPLQAHVISMDVSGFNVRYRDPRDGNWSDTWEEEQMPPSAVEYTIAFGERDGRTPPVVVTRAVEIPVAATIAGGGAPLPGMPGFTANTTNQVQRRSIDFNSGGTLSSQ
ncbi:MAG TPA: prepilin-type N-terminal cleavage/methylation domain-containing protein [Verrucomicrobiae bacterium]|nr:prepilin-type N-terminal cleavage/methylation domain-containing protein [Verrucomicrobiae bacterium]